MKSIIAIILLSISACGPESSPEGRMRIKTQDIQKQVDSLKERNAALLDSINKINQEIQQLKRRDLKVMVGGDTSHGYST